MSMISEKIQMGPVKIVSIPAISNFANLVVYPSKQKVSHYFILNMIKKMKFREKAPFTFSVITVCHQR